MTVADAITAVETATTDYSTAANQTASDQSNVDTAQAKLDALKATVVTDKSNQDTKKTALLSTYDALIQAINDAKAALTGTPAVPIIPTP